MVVAATVGSLSRNRRSIMSVALLVVASATLLLVTTTTCTASASSTNTTLSSLLRRRQTTACSATTTTIIKKSYRVNLHGRGVAQGAFANPTSTVNLDLCTSDGNCFASQATLESSESDPSNNYHQFSNLMVCSDAVLQSLEVSYESGETEILDVFVEDTDQGSTVLESHCFPNRACAGVNFVFETTKQGCRASEAGGIVLAASGGKFLVTTTIGWTSAGQHPRGLCAKGGGGTLQTSCFGKFDLVLQTAALHGSSTGPSFAAPPRLYILLCTAQACYNTETAVFANHRSSVTERTIVLGRRYDAACFQSLTISHKSGGEIMIQDIRLQQNGVSLLSKHCFVNNPNCDNVRFALTQQCPPGEAGAIVLRGQGAEVSMSASEHLFNTRGVACTAAPTPPVLASPIAASAPVCTNQYRVDIHATALSASRRHVVLKLCTSTDCYSKSLQVPSFYKTIGTTIGTFCDAQNDFDRLEISLGAGVASVGLDRVSVVASGQPIVANSCFPVPTDCLSITQTLSPGVGYHCSRGETSTVALGGEDALITVYGTQSGRGATCAEKRKSKYLASCEAHDECFSGYCYNERCTRECDQNAACGDQAACSSLPEHPVPNGFCFATEECVSNGSPLPCGTAQPSKCEMVLMNLLTPQAPDRRNLAVIQSASSSMHARNDTKQSRRGLGIADFYAGNAAGASYQKAIYTIKVKVNVVKQDSNSGGCSTADIRRLVSVLNDAFTGPCTSGNDSNGICRNEDTRPSNAFTPFYFEYNSNTRKVYQPKSPPWEPGWHFFAAHNVNTIKSSLKRGNGNNIMNVYLGDPTSLNVVGVSTFPYQVVTEDGRRRDGIMLRNPALANALPTEAERRAEQKDIDWTLVHEAGHWLGLSHPFQGKSCTDAEGDGVSDTPRQKCPGWDNSGWRNCFFNRGVNDLVDTCKSSSGYDPVWNLMDYGHADCMEAHGHFTPGQIQKMIDNFEFFRLGNFERRTRRRKLSETDMAEIQSCVMAFSSQCNCERVCMDTVLWPLFSLSGLEDEYIGVIDSCNKCTQDSECTSDMLCQVDQAFYGRHCKPRTAAAEETDGGHDTCISGYAYSGGFCRGGPGDPCTVDAQCALGKCETDGFCAFDNAYDNGVPDSCSGGSECKSNFCRLSQCTACSVDDDCETRNFRSDLRTRYCTNEGRCKLMGRHLDQCSGPTYGNECFSGVCRNVAVCGDGEETCSPEYACSTCSEDAHCNQDGTGNEDAVSRTFYCHGGNCVDCLIDSHCPDDSTQYCDTDRNKCVPKIAAGLGSKCFADNHCLSGICYENECIYPCNAAEAEAAARRRLTEVDGLDQFDDPVEDGTCEHGQTCTDISLLLDSYYESGSSFVYAAGGGAPLAGGEATTTGTGGPYYCLNDRLVSQQLAEIGPSPLYVPTCTEHWQCPRGDDPISGFTGYCEYSGVCGYGMYVSSCDNCPAPFTGCGQDGCKIACETSADCPAHFTNHLHEAVCHETYHACHVVPLV